MADNKPSQAEQIAEARVMADAVLRRALSDVEYRSQLERSPVETLVRAGLSRPAAEDFAGELVINGIRPEMPCTHTCSWTCSWTGFLN